MIFIKFNDNVIHYHKSFDEITKLDNYDEIILINCWSIDKLPELPRLLKYLYCNDNSLSSLPKLPDSLVRLNCEFNNLSSLPELPDSLTDLYCNNNNLSSFPELPNSLTELDYKNNPIYSYIHKYFDNNINKYLEFNKKIKKIFINKIENWFLDCKYTPKYKYCRKRLMKEYEELYN
jgi:hypothetical protein